VREGRERIVEKGEKGERREREGREKGERREREGREKGKKSEREGEKGKTFRSKIDAINMAMSREEMAKFLRLHVRRDS